MGWLARTFGTVGKVRFEGITLDGQNFTGKVEIECLGYDKGELELEIKNKMFVETGKRVKTLNIVGFA